MFLSIAEDKYIPKLKELTDAIHAEDGKAGIQLWQGGLTVGMDQTAMILLSSDTELVTGFIVPGISKGTGLLNSPRGRNFEYYSEDPLVSGKMAAAMTRDSQAQYVAAAGGDLFMPGNKGDYDNLLQGIDSGAVTLEQVKINASRVVKTARSLTKE